MTDLVCKFIAPLLLPMGVTSADLYAYVSDCIGYIIAILAALVLMLVVIILARRIPKAEDRPVVRCGAVIAWVLVVTYSVNMICYGPVYKNVSVILNSIGLSISDDSAAASRALIEEIGDEGIVLLKNDGLLPLDHSITALNVFGWDSVSPIFGGTGSGGSDSSTAVGILESLSMAGYETNSELSDMYTAYRSERSGGLSVSSKDWTLPEPPVSDYSDELLQNASDFSDIAVVCVGRTGGEGADEPKDMNAVIHGTYDPSADVSVAAKNYNYYKCVYTNNGDYDDFEPGEHYLELSRTEEDLVDLVCSHFEHVIVVINSNNVMELGWVDDYAAIEAVLFVPGTGTTGMSALGRIISGEVNPSGRTVDTFVYDLTDTPTYANTGGFFYENADDIKQTVAGIDLTYEGTMGFVDYVEGIYVGYRFYETAAVEGLLEYDEKVQYPFGYGLSYTDFSQEITAFADEGDTVTLVVTVTNIGDTAGKSVAELYYTPPYTNGGIEKSAVNLIDYGKTGLLAPGQSQELSFTIAKEDMASYDSGCLRTTNGGYILEAGEYILSLRADSHTVLDEVSFTVAEDIDYSISGRSSDITPAINCLDYTAGDIEVLSRANGFANYASAAAAPSDEEYLLSDAQRAEVIASLVGYYDPTVYDDPTDTMPTLGADNGLTLSDLHGAGYDDERWELLLDQLTAADMEKLINTGGYGTLKLASVGKIATLDCDGPAGLHSIISGLSGTAFPAEVLMAQTWNDDLAERIGDAIGREFADTGTFGWYGPGLNTHRSAFGGRNFEYFSEDGLISGRFAARIVSGAADHGVYAHMKHFALNDQETNREAILLTYADEQTIREIYLKPFELCIKGFTSENDSRAVMTSFNWLGTRPASASAELLNTILRDEWGFCGMVVTDYDGSYGYMISDNSVRNGNDMMLGYWRTPFSNDFTDDSSASCVLAMRKASKNILYTMANSGYYAPGYQAPASFHNMDRLFIAADSLIAALCIITMVRVLRRRLHMRHDQKT